MKKYLFVVFSVFLAGSTFAQDFVRGGNYVTVGYGVNPWGYRGAGNAFGTYKKTTLGPIIATYERGVTDILGIGRIGAGGGISQTFFTEKYNYGTFEDVYRTSRLAFTARAAYHFEFGVEKMDVYAGVGGGVYLLFDEDVVYNIFTDSYVTTRDTRIGGGHYVFGGIRYYFTSAFGVYAEVGHGHRVASGGVVFAF